MIEAPALKRAGRLLFVATILTGSFLLFLVQPMVARMALPRLGGAPAVWNSAMLVYQALLLGGYAYAHALGRFAVRTQAAVHLGVLAIAALWLPIGLIASDPPAGIGPALWVPWLFGLSIAPLFFAVSAQAPLVQRWFAAASGGQDPYRLYAASNLGSFGGLIAYPLLVEPGLALHAQSLVWSAGYAVLVALVLGCAWLLPRGGEERAPVVSAGPMSRARVLHWIVLALVPSGLMLATSTYVTTDIVAMPLLWVIPLGLYLLSFTVAFAARRAVADLLTRIAPVTILLFGGVMMGGYQEMPYANAAIALVLLFMASVALHTQMYRLRPEPEGLTGFYLAMSLGGALGGVFAGLIAPVVFDWTYEYPILILAAGALVPQMFMAHGLRGVWHRHRALAPGIVVVTVGALFVLRVAGPPALFGEERHGVAFVVLAAVGLCTIGARLPYMVVLAGSLLLFGGYRSLALSFDGDARTRSYFGVYTVTDGDRQRMLAHGTTIHGLQLTGSPAREATPTTYYAPGSGVGQAIGQADILYGDHARIGVVGLGTGTLACYARPGQAWRFYEIDPAMVRIARTRFSFLSRCLPDPTIELGDARLSLSNDARGSLDMLALDAFSSDSVPMHLLTREAFATYARVLAPNGVLLVHISNRFLNLQPVVSAAARAGGWRAMRLAYRPSTLDAGASLSVWIALSRDPVPLTILYTHDHAWTPLRRYPGFAAWTDDYSTILPLLR